MSAPLATILLVAGLVIIWKAADLLVSGAVGFARYLGVSPMVIGLTVVAMGTSAPEVAASITAVREGMGDLAVGNVYGSNIANLALAGGLCALIRPIRVASLTLKREIPAMVAVAFVLWPIVSDLNISIVEGVVLLVIFAGLVAFTVYSAKKDVRQDESLALDSQQTDEVKHRSVSVSILFIALGLAGLVLGAKITIRGAVVIGEIIGLSEAVIGQTIVAIGTSLPEIVTCIVAVKKGHDDIVIGNLVGSNVFNALLVMGVAGVCGPFEITASLAGVDYFIMIAVSCVFVAMAMIGKKIGRLDGLVLCLSYAGYLVYLLCYSGSM